MPSLLCASSILLDQSFPRNNQQLNMVAIALGEIEELISSSRAHFIITEGLRDLVEEYDWSPPRPYALLNDIHRLINQWLLQPHDGLVSVDVSQVVDYEPHPRLLDVSGEGLSEYWSDEIGRLLALHDEFCEGSEFFIGIVCEAEFANEGQCTYEVHNNNRVFPVIGPNSIASLGDAYTWQTPPNVHLQNISFQEAYNNCHLLGALRIESPSGGSHYKVIFEDSRPWVLDPNVNPIPSRFLRELVEITGFPMDVIKVILTTGQFPPRILKFHRE